MLKWPTILVTSGALLSPCLAFDGRDRREKKLGEFECEAVVTPGRSAGLYVVI